MPVESSLEHNRFHNRPGWRKKSAEQLFHEKYIVDAVSGCWVWQAATFRTGYGQFNPAKSGKPTTAHRFSWQLHHGVIGDPKIFVCHKCDNRLCCNPSHLFLGSAADNSADMVSKNRGRNVPSFGEKNSSAKITAKDARAIFSDERTQSQIADDFGITQACVSLIKRRRTWREATKELRFRA